MSKEPDDSQKSWPMWPVFALAVIVTFLEVWFAARFFLSAMQDGAAAPTIDDIGSYVGGVAGAIGFVWILAGFCFQWRELGMQRLELKYQRVAIERSASAAQLEIALTLRELHGKKLAENARQIAAALYTAVEREQPESRYSEGVESAYMLWLLRRLDLRQRVSDALQKNDLFAMAQLEAYLNYDQKYLSMVEQADDENKIVLQTLQVEAPSQLAKVLRTALESAIPIVKES
jgi:hypothetical protein